jgi:hypothetical protein
MTKPDQPLLRDSMPHVPNLGPFAFSIAYCISAWASLRRCINVGLQLDKVHERLIRGPHWRLLVLAAESSKPKENAGELLAPVLSRADSDGLPCYVETFNESDLAFYKRYGFRIAGGGNIPRGGPDFWAMIRTPQAASLK